MIRTARFALLICLLIKVTARAISSDAYELLSSRELGAACRDKDIDSLLISENEKLLVAVDHIPIVQKRSTPTGAAYTYYGGPVISNVEITVIFHGAATNYQLELEKYYQFLVNSSYIDVLAEYSTKTQIISRGSFKGTYVEQNVFNKTVLDDIKDIQPYVVNLVKSGVINPTANSLYPIHFAPGYQISQGGGVSCKDFCGYHGTATFRNVTKNTVSHVFYTVLPDQSGTCFGRCGGSSSVLSNLQSVSSHEFCEAIVNPAVGAATQYASPLSWYSSKFSEIGDVCNAMESKAIDWDGTSYTVQKVERLWGVYPVYCQYPSKLDKCYFQNNDHNDPNDIYCQNDDKHGFFDYNFFDDYNFLDDYNVDDYYVLHLYDSHNKYNHDNHDNEHNYHKNSSLYNHFYDDINHNNNQHINHDDNHIQHQQHNNKHFKLNHEHNHELHKYFLINDYHVNNNHNDFHEFHHD
ncbi:hypothetical protein HDU82_008645 [Entophlyctis luteolus]|nr:hypothetical protein HDU82_008645 [Entophlyctis luteolus]